MSLEHCLSEFIRIRSVAEGVALVTIDRPPVNAVSWPMYTEIATAFGELSARSDVKAVVLAGGGERAFVAGTDVSVFEQLTRSNAGAFFRDARASVTAIDNCAKPVIGALNGAALGIGVVFAACCDVLIGGPGVYFRLPEIELGLIGGASHAERLVPRMTAKRMALLGETVSIDQARSWGAIADIVDVGDVLERAILVGVKISKLGPIAVEKLLNVSRLAQGGDALRGLELEHAVGTELIWSKEARHGVADFLGQKSKGSDSQKSDRS